MQSPLRLGLVFLTFLLYSSNSFAQLDFPLSSSIESPIYLNPARAGDAGDFRLSLNQRSQSVNPKFGNDRWLLSADWNFKDSKYGMAITGSIVELNQLDRYNLGVHLVRRQKLFDQIDLSVSVGLDQNYQRLDFWWFYDSDFHKPDAKLYSYGISPSISLTSTTKALELA